MEREIISSGRSTLMRKNNSRELSISISPKNHYNIFIVNGNSFITEGITSQDLIVKSEVYYMVINNGENSIEIKYNKNISQHKIVYDPYKFENSQKIKFKPEIFIERYSVPKSYIDTLPKWYSFKFTYSDYNLIFIRPEFGISIQVHKYRNEFWEVIEGCPIIINGNSVHYFVKNGTKFKNPMNSFHSVINPNKESNKFVVIKERWSGKFDENDIMRIFNPNQYH
jgi:mannose-6-phosphate isomerase-like protein (cupin superfamily)